MTGYGKKVWTEGGYYEGNFLNGYNNGYGEYHWENGDVYKGNYISEVRSGSGEYYWKNGDVYKGNWSSNMMNGEGTLIKNDGSIQKGTFERGNYIDETTKIYAKSEDNKLPKPTVKADLINLEVSNSANNTNSAASDCDTKVKQYEKWVESAINLVKNPATPYSRLSNFKSEWDNRFNEIIGQCWFVDKYQQTIASIGSYLDLALTLSLAIRESSFISSNSSNSSTSNDIQSKKQATKSNTVYSICQWCNSKFTGIGWSFDKDAYGDDFKPTIKVFEGKHKQLAYYDFALSLAESATGVAHKKSSNIGDYCSRKCATEAAKAALR